MTTTAFAAIAAALFASASLREPPAPPAATPAATPAPRVAQDSPTLAADLAILARLEVPFATPKSYADTTVEEVVKDIKAATGLSVDVDRRAIGDAGAWEVVRIDGEPATPRAALNAIARAISPDYQTYSVDVASGLVVFTDDSGRKSLAAPRSYDLAPVVAQVRASGQSDADAAALVLNQILQSVVPELWSANGGDAARAELLGTSLAVSASPAIHHEVAQKLAALAATLPPATLLWEVTMLEMPLAKADAADARRAIAAGDLASLTALGASVVAAPRVLTGRDQPAEISIGSDTEGLAISISPEGEPMSRAFAVRVTRRKAAVVDTVAFRCAGGERGWAMLGGSSANALVVLVSSRPPTE